MSAPTILEDVTNDDITSAERVLIDVLASAIVARIREEESTQQKKCPVTKGQASRRAGAGGGG